MQQQTDDTTQSTLQNSVDSDRHSSTNFKNEQWEDTPLRIVGTEEDGFRITIGRNALTQPATRQQTEHTLKGVNWSFIITLVFTLMEQYEEFKKTNN